MKFSAISVPVVAFLVFFTMSVSGTKVRSTEHSELVSTVTAARESKFDSAPAPAALKYEVASSVRADTCCYNDGCTGVHSCFPAGSYFTDGCGRTYDIAPDCSIKRKTCCYYDACNKHKICFQPITYFKDSCGSGYIVFANCHLNSVWLSCKYKTCVKFFV